MAPEVERRLAAIMFTDIVGYTALMAESEENGLRVRARHREVVRPLVDEYHGESIELRGDESLSVFPTALDAVNCALAIEERLRADPELRLHIGIHLGDLVMQEGEVSGDGVNIASRLCALSEGGGISVSGEVYRSIRNQPGIEATALGEQTLKNVPEPVVVYAVSGAAAPPRAVSAAAPAPRRSSRLPSIAAAAALVGIGIVAAWLYQPAAVDTRIRSIAVLPLENLSGDPEQEYFADGMTDALIGDLAKLGSLRVISRTSVMHHKGTRRELPEVARELEADVIVEGSVLRAGDRVRITAQLIDAQSDTHLWSESYERDLRNILALQAEVAQAIAREVAHELSPRARARFTPERGVDPIAYDATLKGMHLVWSLTPSDHRRSVAYFDQALRADPDYAPAYAGLAWAYT